jgi:repressor LexA
VDNHFGIYLRSTREARKLTINQLALYSKVSAALISRIENGQRSTPKPDTLRKLSDALKIPYGELMAQAGYHNPKMVYHSDPNQRLNQLHETASDFQESIKEIKKIPVYKPIAANGMALSKEPVDYLYLHQKFTGNDEYFGLIVTEDSFAKEGIKPGCKLIIRKQDFIDTAKIAVCYILGDSGLLKRITIQDDLFIVQTANTKPMIKRKNEVQIIGQVVQLIVEL